MEQNKEYKQMQTVFGLQIKQEGIYKGCLGLKPVCYYYDDDVKNYPDLKLEIDKANAVAGRYLGSKLHAEKKIAKSNEAINRVRQFAESLGVKEVKQDKEMILSM